MLPPPTAEQLQLPDRDLGILYWRAWIETLLQRRGLELGDLTPEIEETLRKVTLNVDGDNMAIAGEEKFLRRLARGEYEEGGRLIRQYSGRKAVELATLDEAKTGRRKQQARARMPRGDALADVIAEVVRANPKLTYRGLLAQLRARAEGDDDLVQDIDETSIQIADEPGGPARPYPLAGLADRLSRAKKKFRNGSGT